MAIYIDNDVELQKAMYNAAKQVVANVSEMLVQEVKKRIDMDVYRAARGRRRYYARGAKNPTYQFRDTWENKIEDSQYDITGVVYQEWQEMELDAANFVHGSYCYKPTDDVREFLAEIINEGAAGPIFGNGFWRKKRPFWDNAMKILQDGTMDKWIKKEFKKLGIELI